MTTLFERTKKFGGISGDYALVTALVDLVLISSVDVIVEEGMTIAMRPDQARALAAGILAAAEQAEGSKEGCTHCHGRSANDRCLNCGAQL